MPSRVLAALARAARAGASTETLAPYARAAKAVLADVARGRTRVGTGTGTREAFAEARASRTSVTNARRGVVDDIQIASTASWRVGLCAPRVGGAI